MQNAAVAGIDQTARRIIGAEEIRGRNAIEAQLRVGAVDEHGWRAACLEPAAQLFRGVDTDEKQAFGAGGLQIFLYQVRLRPRFPDKADVEAHAALGSPSAQTFQNAFVENAQAARDAVAGNQCEAAGFGFRCCLQRIAEIARHLEDVLADRLADAGFVGEYTRHGGNGDAGCGSNVGLSDAFGADIVHIANGMQNYANLQ